MRTLSLSALLVLAVACGDASGTPAASSTATANGPAAPKGNAAKPAPTGPMFKATMMGTDMSRPIVEVDLAPAGLAGFVIQAPEGARVEKGRPGGAAHVVAAGVNYSVAIWEGKFDAAQNKKSFALLDPEGTVLTDTPDLVVFQRKGGGSVLFGMGVTAGGKTFTCGSLATAVSFEKATVDQTIESCRTLKKK